MPTELPGSTGLCASLSHTHYWYEVVIALLVLKVPAFEVLPFSILKCKAILVVYFVQKGARMTAAILIVGVCVCVCVLSSHLSWTSDMWTRQPGSHRISPPFSCDACLPFSSREGFNHPFPSSIVKSNFVYPRNNRFPLVGHDARKNPTSCDCAKIRTHVPMSEGFEVTN